MNTSGSGFIGRNIIELLNQKQYYTVSYDIADRNNNANEHINGDMLDLEKLSKAMKDIDYVFNLAAVTSPPEFEDIDSKGYEINIIGTYNILKSADRFGKGGAVKKGLSMAQFEYIGYIDADGSLDPKDLRELLRQIQTYYCVIASRYLKQSRWINKEPFFNRFVSRGFNILINLVLKLEVKDTQCGSKFFRMEALQRVLP